MRPYVRSLWALFSLQAEAGVDIANALPATIMVWLQCWISYVGLTRRTLQMPCSFHRMWRVGYPVKWIGKRNPFLLRLRSRHGQ
jgi:hypothetical protein